MSSFEIFEVAIPATLDGPDARDFIEAVGVKNATQAAGYGTEDFWILPEELLPSWLDQKHEPKRMFAVRSGDRLVARGVSELQPDDPVTAWLLVEVHPDFRGQGIGTALADHTEQAAADEGRTKFIVYAVSSDGPGERVPAPTGFGSVPRDNPEVRFLLTRGYQLEQVERGSRLALPLDEADLTARLMSATNASGTDYELLTWADQTPPEWQEDLAALYTRMSTDAPSAGLEEPEDIWSVERLIAGEARRATSPMTQLVTVVLHRPSRRLVGFTELAVPAEPDRPAQQEDTLVLKEHRGHGLGLLLKLSNLAQLQQTHPGHPAILTFNAEENRHMLDVNESLGFVPIGYEGAWKKTIAP